MEDVLEVVRGFPGLAEALLASREAELQAELGTGGARESEAEEERVDDEAGEVMVPRNSVVDEATLALQRFAGGCGTALRSPTLPRVGRLAGDGCFSSPLTAGSGTWVTECHGYEPLGKRRKRHVAALEEEGDGDEVEVMEAVEAEATVTEAPPEYVKEMAEAMMGLE
ncbi:hypothetical protein RHMOL_Rhmol07G0192400 [Rhododendron molle]|uniref:Uncharacterized protein n=1 Tax=Rhododendron molle TaxID=49168 RepID=A0ACC0N323_RHOML|nr:hypothetical protein RHMOL_Rhmol07G0192400 [Rhododendron molle]